MSAAGATLLTFTRKRVPSSPSAGADECAAKRPRVGEPGSAQGSPWARVRSSKPPSARQPGVGRPLFTALAGGALEKAALGPSRSHNSRGDSDTAGQRRSGGARLPASGLQAKVEFFHAVDQEVRASGCLRRWATRCRSEGPCEGSCAVSCGRTEPPSRPPGRHPPRAWCYACAARPAVAPVDVAVAPTAVGGMKQQLTAATHHLHRFSPGAHTRRSCLSKRRCRRSHAARWPRSGCVRWQGRSHQAHTPFPAFTRTSLLASFQVPFPTPGPASLRPPLAPPSLHRVSPQPSGLLASLGRGGGGSGGGGPSHLMRPPPRHVTTPGWHHPDPDGVSCSVFEGATNSVRARWEAVVAASPGDAPPPPQDAMQLDGADATSPAPGTATRMRRDMGNAGGGDLRRPIMPRVPADLLLAAAAGDDDAPDSVLGAPAETWCNPPPSARVEATGSVAEAAAAGGHAQAAVAPHRGITPPPPSSPGDGRAATGSGSGGGVYTLLMNAVRRVKGGSHHAILSLKLTPHSSIRLRRTQPHTPPARSCLLVTRWWSWRPSRRRQSCTPCLRPLRPKTPASAAFPCAAPAATPTAASPWCAMRPAARPSATRCIIPTSSPLGAMRPRVTLLAYLPCPHGWPTCTLRHSTGVQASARGCLRGGGRAMRHEWPCSRWTPPTTP